VKVTQQSINSEQPPAITSAASSDELPRSVSVYEGRTFDQWILLTLTERSTEELTKAVDAIGILGRGERDRDAAKAILAVIEQYEFVDPPSRTDEQSKLMITAIRSMRGLNPDETVRAIAEDFSVRRPSVHEFVLSGLLLPREMIDRGGGGQAVTEKISLGKTEPLASKLRADEKLALQMIQLSELNSGVWSPEKYPTFASSTWFGGDPVFHFIRAHVGHEKPSANVESYLRQFAVDPSQIPEDQQLPWEAVAAASMLGRHSSEELHAKIFVRAIRDNLKQLRANSGGSGISGGGLGGGGGSPDTWLRGQIEAWKGLALLGKDAEPAVPFMLEILSPSTDRDSVFSELGVWRIWSEESNLQSEYQVSMRLFAIEVLASSGTQDVKALEILKAELKLLLEQEPSGGPFELAPGRIGFLLFPPDRTSLSAERFVFSHSQRVSQFDIEMTNSCLLAWKALTGTAPRFAEASLGPLTSAERPPGTTVDYMPKILPGRQDLQ